MAVLAYQGRAGCGVSSVAIEVARGSELLAKRPGGCYAGSKSRGVLVMETSTGGFETWIQ